MCSYEYYEYNEREFEIKQIKSSGFCKQEVDVELAFWLND